MSSTSTAAAGPARPRDGAPGGAGAGGSGRRGPTGSQSRRRAGLPRTAVVRPEPGADRRV